MPTATTMFPDLNVLPNYRRQRIHATLVEESFGKAQKMPLLPAGGQDRFTFNTMPMPVADRAALHAFLELQRGSLGTFYFAAKDRRTYLQHAAGNISGIVTSYVLPFIFVGATFGVVKVDGVTKTIGVDYNVNDGGAPFLNRALLEFTGVQTPDGGAITIDVVGRDVVIVRQDSDTEDEAFLEGADEYGSSTIALIEEL